MPRRLLAVVAVIAAIVTLLHLVLWSRVVRIDCERGEVASCTVHEVSLVLAKHTRVEIGDATRAELRGAVDRTRGDVWIVLVGPSGERPLTSGFNGDKHGQLKAAEQLTAYLRSTAMVTYARFGDRWLTAWIFLFVFGGLLVLTYPFFGYRVHVTIDRGEGTMTIRRGVWPFFGSASLPLAALIDFRVEGDGRVRLVANVKGQSPVACTYRIAHRGLLSHAAERLNDWLRSETVGGYDRTFPPQWRA